MYPGIAYYEISLTGYVMESGVCARNFAGLDAVDGWSAGYLRDGKFLSLAHEMRSKQTPALKGRLEIPVLSGEPCIRAVSYTHLNPQRFACGRGTALRTVRRPARWCCDGSRR